jgi:hypothetical protein
LPNDVSGWWLIFAEVLAVVVLLVLAAVTGQTARTLSADIDRQALADLALSDPLEVCVNGEATMTDWLQSHGPLVLLPQFKWPDGTLYQRVSRATDVEGTAARRRELTLFEGHRNNTSLDDITLSAMYRCELVAGRASGTDSAEAIRNNSLDQLINSLPNFEYRVNLAVDGHTYQVGLLTFQRSPLVFRQAYDAQAFGGLLGLSANDSIVPLHGPLVPLQPQHSPTFDVSNASSRLYPAEHLQVYSFVYDESPGLPQYHPMVSRVPPLFVRFAYITDTGGAIRSNHCHASCTAKCTYDRMHGTPFQG